MSLRPSHKSLPVEYWLCDRVSNKGTGCGRKTTIKEILNTFVEAEIKLENDLCVC
jgi:hypothetical protein